jgi:methyltransferase (TIGR00027 family)
MKHSQPSRTAEYMAFFRAMESVRPADRRLFADPFAAHFIRPSLQRLVRFSRSAILAGFVNWYTDRRLPGARTSGIARTRLIDDALGGALGENIPQVVILGAGFDCRAYRLSCLNKATVFEVDHPTTLATKLARLRDLLPKIPANVRFVEIDFNRQTLPEVLTQSGFDPSRPAVFVWEGVTNYLTPEAVDSVLCYVAGCSRGSRVIFTYVHAGVLDGSVHFDGARHLLREVAQLDEPWTFGLFPNEVAEFLCERGLCLDRDLSAREYRSQYFGPPAQWMKGYEFYHVAIAHVQEGQNQVAREAARRERVNA